MRSTQVRVEPHGLSWVYVPLALTRFAPRTDLSRNAGEVKLCRGASPTGCFLEPVAAPPYSPRIALATILRWISFEPP